MATPNLSPQNYFSTQLSAGITTTDTTIFLAQLPTGSEGYLEIDEGLSTKEIIYYTSKGSNFVTLPSVGAGRGVGGTSAAAHSSGATVKMKLNAEWFKALQDGSAINWSVAPTIANGLITAPMLSTNTITLGYAQSTADFSTSTIADITSLSVTVTIPAGGRKVRITGFAGNASSSSASNGGIMYIVDATASAQLAVSRGNSDASGDGFTLNPIAVHTPSAGSRTYKLQLGPGSNVTTIHTNGAANNPVFILVEAI